MNLCEHFFCLAIAKLVIQPILRLAASLGIIAPTNLVAQRNNVGRNAAGAVLTDQWYQMISRYRVEQPRWPTANSAAAAKVIKGKMPIFFREIMGKARPLRPAIAGVRSKLVAVAFLPPSTRVWVVGVTLLCLSVDLAVVLAVAVAPPSMVLVNPLSVVSLVFRSACFTRRLEPVGLSTMPVEIFSRGRQPVLTFTALLLGYIWSMIGHVMRSFVAFDRAAGLSSAIAAVSYCVDLNYSTFTRSVQLQGAYIL